MLDPNSFVIARAIHEQRVAEAIRKQQHRPRRTPRVGLLTRWSLRLGNYLIRGGARLKRSSSGDTNQVGRHPEVVVNP